jgi:hypothetical protein
VRLRVSAGEGGSESGAECGGRQEPVSNGEIRNSLVFVGIVGNDDQSKGLSMNGVQQVMRANCLALLF